MGQLEKCETCDGAISGKAIACVHCGEPRPKSVNFIRSFLGFFFYFYAYGSAIAGVFCILLFGGISMVVLHLWMITVIVGIKVFEDT